MQDKTQLGGVLMDSLDWAGRGAKFAAGSP
jgi:hypothetical protein